MSMIPCSVASAWLPHTSSPGEYLWYVVQNSSSFKKLDKISRRNFDHASLYMNSVRQHYYNDDTFNFNYAQVNRWTKKTQHIFYIRVLFGLWLTNPNWYEWIYIGEGDAESVPRSWGIADHDSEWKDSQRLHLHAVAGSSVWVLHVFAK